jgi:hypothetical protein
MLYFFLKAAEVKDILPLVSFTKHGKGETGIG